MSTKRPFNLARLKRVDMMKYIRGLHAGQLLGWAVRLTLAVFALFGGLIVLTWLLTDRIPSLADSDLWNMMEGLASLFSFAVVVGGGVVIASQLVESADARTLDVFDNIFQRWMSDEQIDARRYIYQELPADPAEWFANPNPDGQRKIKLVLNALDYLGFLFEQNWINDEGIVRWVSPIAVKVWARLEPYVDYEIARGKEADYYAEARKMAERCIRYRQRTNKDEQITWLGKDAL